MRRAIVVGYSGQDGSLLVQDLCRKQYQVLGIGRESVFIDGSVSLETPVDIRLKADVYKIMQEFKPDEVYYLAAYHSSSERSNSSPTPYDLFITSQNTHVTGLLHFLSAIVDIWPETRLFYASSSLVFSGDNGEVQDELTPLDPRCVYGITKAQGMWLCREYRQKYNVFASVGILYNHESYLRPPQFLTSKIIHAAIRIAAGGDEKIEIGNLLARVDWGYAKDYIVAFQKILALDSSEDFVIATGEAHTVEEFASIAMNFFNLDNDRYIVTNDELLLRRPAVKIGNAEKLRALTGWKPSFKFNEFVTKLIEDHVEAKNNFGRVL